MRVEYYGSPTPLKQHRADQQPGPASIVIRPFEADDLKDIEKAIRSSDLGMAPNNDGKMIRLTVPAMSGDQRKKMVRRSRSRPRTRRSSAATSAATRNKHFDDAEKDKAMTEDERDKGKEKVQDLLKTYEGKIDELATRRKRK